MGWFKRNDDPIVVEFSPPPPDDPMVRARVEEIDRKLTALVLIRDREAGTRARMDQLLDVRNSIRRPRVLRPSVPVTRHLHAPALPAGRR